MTKATVSAQWVLQTLDKIRRQAGLPPVMRAQRITRELARKVAADVWAKYPQALVDPGYTLGEFTLRLVEQEIWQRLDDMRRGVVVKQAALKDYFN